MGETQREQGSLSAEPLRWQVNPVQSQPLRSTRAAPSMATMQSPSAWHLVTRAMVPAPQTWGSQSCREDVDGNGLLQVTNECFGCDIIGTAR